MLQRALKQAEGFFEEVLVSVSKGQRFEFLSCRFVGDEAEGHGPPDG